MTGFVLIIIETPQSFTAHASTITTTNSTLQNQINANNQQISDLNQKIAEYESELKIVGANKKTLQAAINSLTLQRSKIETQINVTQHQIDTTKLQVEQLGSDIASTEQTITKNQSALGEYFRDFETADNQSIIEILLSPGTFSEKWNDVSNISEIQNTIKDKMEALQTQKIDLANTKSITEQKQSTLTSQKQLLTSQEVSLAAAKDSKNQLLTETNGEESKYEALIAAAKAQITAFSAFAKNAGGSGLLSNQTSCDSWGCYYNQRDSSWGNDSLNGTSFRLASDGCLITSLAMVMTHYGYTSVTPETINDNPDNFATYYPSYLLYTTYVDGVVATRITAKIDTTLATGNPVIVGLYAYGGTHFVVLVSGKSGNYIMRDPYIAEGKDISFSDHYSVNKIFEINKVEISS